MRHQVSGRKIGRTTSHRWALFRNLATSLVEHERIETTLEKAKELRPFADYLVTLGKKDTLWARRQALSFVRSQPMVSKVFSDLALRFKDRAGGYTRIFKLGHRLGDAAQMAIIEYLPSSAPQKEATASKKPKTKKEPTQSAVKKKK